MAKLKLTGNCPGCGHRLAVGVYAETFVCPVCRTAANTEYLQNQREERV